METTEPLSIEDAAESLLLPIETEADEADGETQETETEDVEDEAEDDASEVEDEETDEEAETSEDDEADDQGEDDDENPDSDDSESEPTFIVKVNGEERKITEQELKNDYAGRAALQQRHEQLKSQEEQFQAFAQAMQQERQQLLYLAQQAQENGFKAPPVEPDPALMQSDPIGYMEAEARYRQEMKAYQTEQQQIHQYRQQQEAAIKQQQQQMLAQQRETLLQEIPEFADPKKGREIQRALVETAKAYQFSDEEIGGITDARTVKLLNDARKYRELQAGKQAAKKPKEQAKPVTRPKGKPRDGGKQVMAKKQLQKARKTQSLEDWADLLLE